MDLQTVRSQAKEKLKGYCRVCPVCDGRACAGEVPGMGGTGTGIGFRNNLTALASYSLNLRTMHEAKNPCTATELFGIKLSSPIMAAPMTGTPYNMGGALTEREFIGMIVSGSKQAGTIGWTGDGADPAMYTSGLEAITAEAGFGIPIIKPREQQVIIDCIRRAEAAGAKAVGVDIDGAGLVTMALKGQPVGPKTFDEIQELVNSTRLPFILKGIMTVDEAETAVKAGVSAIVVSNHGGRILDFTPGAAEVLPAIAAAVKGKITILADGGVRSGVDVLKLLALGADGVLVGRPLVVGAFGGGAAGVKLLLEKMTAELKQAMILTGCSTIQDINQRVIYKA
ncbi:alpha-hydroxy-acid oxidizing protein [Desulforamulus hydrothermalis]|uniref:alpha-hydroxy-acid oxidizing protein n=1 Tax=Desulforamulus hydrothermalis TaxID=412895 RepID=UPI00091808FA|nr:alpha-hydroxy-acid oxidizing protein [Desulforamulus hydrothermalis]SHH48678.1 FMN-dependent dehydrogenase, includes L-lactate dehydrogenase and type II isopentenyl diphosphate isomerase [Desulforamulus hydrothermalis Lam5 = DSM 18033]